MIRAGLSDSERVRLAKRAERISKRIARELARGFG
jgi:hypothetical protein